MTSVIIVGAGILGASVARRLVQLGARVQIFDQHQAIASGVSGHSFGWVNLINGDPAGPPGAYALRTAAVAEFAQLAADFADPPWCKRVGAIVWREDPRDTQLLIDCHRLAGAAIRPVGAREIRALEPALAAPPGYAAHCPDDRAVDVAAMVRALLWDAQARGAFVVLGEPVAQIAPHDGQRAAAITTTGAYDADVIVLANALGANTLLQPLGITLPVAADPAVLLRLVAGAQLARGIICSPTLEVRQSLDGILYVAEEPDPAGDDERLAGPVTRRVVETFGPAPDLQFISAARAARPIPTTCAPVVGFVPGAPGIYALVAHPGVILGPLLANAAAAEITGGRRDPLLGDWAAEL